MLLAAGHRLVVEEPAMKALYALAKRLARSSMPVLVCGETGVGKELVAAMLHSASPRSKGPFVSVNCAAIPDLLAESELFGHVKGAFTGAVADRLGVIEASDGGTLFLDEIGELSPNVQAKLLRVLESGEVLRIGDLRPRKLNLRIVSATNRDLEREVEAQRFRSDLYFRLGAARLCLPRLAERPRDLERLAHSLLADACARLGRTALELSQPAMRVLFGYAWPGNVRELRHAIDYAAVTVPDAATTVELVHLPDAIRNGNRVVVPAVVPSRSSGGVRRIADEVRDLERASMVEALRVSGGVRNRAARMIDMPLRTFVTKLKRFAIEPREWSPA
jgi:two-component system, NtrC family, response regulator AtoC